MAFDNMHEKISGATRVILTAGIIASGIKANLNAHAAEVNPQGGPRSSELGPGDTGPIKLENGNYEMFSIAKIAYEGDAISQTGKWVNKVKPGERGYVYGIGEEGSPKLELPLRVAGYYFVKEVNFGETGVTLFEYREIQTNNTK